MKEEKTRKPSSREAGDKKVALSAKEGQPKKVRDKKRGDSIPGRGKLYSKNYRTIDSAKRYNIQDAFVNLASFANRKFDETVEIAFRLGVDPKHADQMVRGALVLPNGIGKSVKVAVLAKGDKARDAQAAGAEHVGADDLIEKISGGWMDFDRLIATPDMMVAVSKVGKILGPRGLMPNPKLGTVTMDVSKAVKEQKLGKIEYKTEKTGIVHAIIGKKSFGAEKLKENFMAMANAILRAKPQTSKGQYIRSVTLSCTMSPGIKIDPSDVMGIVG